MAVRISKPPMRVLVACEFSGIVRDAFIAEGCNAISCDLIPTERPGPHHIGDVLPLLRQPWDLVIAHPPCTYLSNSGVRWLMDEPGRWEKMIDGCEFFKAMLNANSPKVCVENPIPHGYAVERIRMKYNQIIKPSLFGHAETKYTCLWLLGLPPLYPTDVISKKDHGLTAPIVNNPDCLKHSIWMVAPGPNRGHERSRTFQGIADAMAKQWGHLPY